MSNGLSVDTLRGAASVVCSAAITLVGAWLLVLITGTVALFAVALVAGLYVPLRWRTMAWNERVTRPSSPPRLDQRSA